MIAKLRILGDYWIEHGKHNNPLQLNRSFPDATLLLLKFTLQNGRCSFEGIESAEYDSEKVEQVLYKNAPGNDVSEFPTVFLDNEFAKTTHKLLRILKGNALINPQLMPLLECYTDQMDEILSHLSKNGNTLISFYVNHRYIGESEYFKPIINHAMENRFADCYQKYQTESRGSNSVCYVCGELKKELWGFVNTFNFYSANELAVIAGGFKKQNSWINYPVCPECADRLRAARDMIEIHFTSNFHGNDFFIIPAPLLDKTHFVPIVDNLLTAYKPFRYKKDLKLSYQEVVEAEEEVFSILAAQKDQASFTLFFYKENNSEFKIMQEIQDVLPSQFKKLSTAQQVTREYDEFKELKGLYKKDAIDDLKFDFGILRNFFNKDHYNPEFLDLVARILKNKPVSKEFILKRLMDHLSEKFQRNEMYHEFFKAMILLKFLFYLNLINNKPLNNEVTMAGEYELYFSRHPEFFDADVKKAVFLEGLLVQKLLNWQWRDRNATPFRNRLNGLKIDEKIIKRLLPEVVEKLEQYKRNYYKDLEEAITVYMISGEPDLKRMSINEISFYFAMGMNLAKQFNRNEEQDGGSHEQAD